MQRLSSIADRPTAILAFAAILLIPSITPAAQPPIAPYEYDTPFTPANPIDTHVLNALEKQAILPARLCSDAVFIRRAYLDITGTLPEPKQVRDFFADKSPTKRSTLIDTLLESETFADYWSLKWCDILRVKAEFPINLWPNAVQAYHRWLRDALRDNLPYDRFARRLLTSSGSNFRVPPVNFYRAIQGREPATIASAVALNFMGVRFDKWPNARRNEMAAFFSHLAYKSTAEWKEEIVYLDPAPVAPLTRAVLPDGTKVTLNPDDDPRKLFADWLITPENPWFARNIVNRLWSWLLGRGIIHEPDDIRPDNPPSNPQLLAYLEKELIAADYDLRHIYRLILNSSTYQQSPIPQTRDPNAAALFASYPVRRIEAEVLIDALCSISGTTESYSSLIPEPFTFIPPKNRSIELADGSITSQFLEMFGRPPRDTGLESERSNAPSDPQRLHLLNSTHIQKKIERSRRLTALTRTAARDRNLLINSVYLTIISRYPTEAELAAAKKYFETPRLNTAHAVNDLAWALINTKEFLYHH